MPAHGMRVTDIAHRPIGVVESAANDALEIRLRDGRVVAVAMHAVFGVDHGVQLICNRDQLHRYQVDD